MDEGNASNNMFIVGSTLTHTGENPPGIHHRYIVAEDFQQNKDVCILAVEQSHIGIRQNNLFTDFLRYTYCYFKEALLKL